MSDNPFEIVPIELTRRELRVLQELLRSGGLIQSQFEHLRWVQRSNNEAGSYNRSHEAALDLAALDTAIQTVLMGD
jgi:hypothetical protein